jgi:hypothetical protein
MNMTASWMFCHDTSEFVEVVAGSYFSFFLLLLLYNHNQILEVRGLGNRNPSKQDENHGCYVK